MALMDAGVPIEPTVGISIGLLSSDPECSEYRLLTDIMGIEDHLGDMDFKIASTKDGITGLQLDIKLTGIPPRILEEALYQAKACRPTLMEVITRDLKTARPCIKHNAPLVEILRMPTKRLSSIIGTGGHVLRGIQQESGAELETDMNESTLEIVAKDARTMEHAKRLVNNIVGLRHDSGDLLTVTVKAIIEGKGAVVMTDDEKEHLITESHFFMPGEKANVIAVGQTVEVMCLERIGFGGMELSRKAALLSKSDNPNDRANYLLLLRQTAKDRQMGIIQSGRANLSHQRRPSPAPMPSSTIFPKSNEPSKPWPWAGQAVKTEPTPAATDNAESVETILQRLKTISQDLSADVDDGRDNLDFDFGMGSTPISKPVSGEERQPTIDDTMGELLEKLKVL